jgi:excisionase family DNA binding protein
VLLLTVPEAAAALSLGTTTVRGMINDGNLPHVRLGRVVRPPTNGLARWVEEQTRYTRETDDRAVDAGRACLPGLTVTPNLYVVRRQLQVSFRGM